MNGGFVSLLAGGCSTVVIVIAIVIAIGFGREHSTIFPMAESKTKVPEMANYTTIPEGAQIAAKALGIPLEELIFGGFSRNEENDKLSEDA
jgi:hypothetical protein